MIKTLSRILVVEDDTIQRNAMQRIITYYFPTALVTAVSTGYDALVAYQNGGVDLLILDHRLPDVIGSALLQYMRETGVNTPTILVSGILAREAVTTDAHTVFMPKPLVIPEFIATITHVLSYPDRNILAV